MSLPGFTGTTEGNVVRVCVTLSLSPAMDTTTANSITVGVNTANGMVVGMRASRIFLQYYYCHVVVTMAGSDYRQVSTILTFPSGSSDDATVCLDVNTIDDDTLENPELLTIVLTTTETYVTVDPAASQTTVTIVDNDGEVEVLR